MKLSGVMRFLSVCLVIITLFGVGSNRGSTSASSAFPLSPHNRVGVYLTSYSLTKPGTLASVLAAAQAGMINAVVINVKNMHGEITYASNVPLARKIGAVATRIDPRTIIPKLHAAGIYVIARQVLFYDPKLAAYLGISGAWVSPESPQVVAYNLAIANETASLGFDEIQFDYLRFPDGEGLGTGYGPRYAAIDAFLDRARRLLAGRVFISADLFGRVMWNWNKKLIDPIGQSLEQIGARVDFLSPMLYPSHYHEQYYKSDPYRVVHDALVTGRARVTTPIRPFLQAFDLDIPRGMSLEDYIRAEIKAVQDVGADGYLFWNPSSDYTALYRALSR